MPKHTASHHKTAVRHTHTHAARPRRHAKAKAMHGHKPAPERTQPPALTMMVEQEPPVIEVVDFDFSEPEEVFVTGFEDEDL